MPQPNQGKPASSAPTSQPIRGASGSGASNGDNIKFGGPGGTGTRGK